jgi:hypothetical protein
MSGNVYSSNAASAPGIRAGVVYWTIDGENFDVVSDATYNPNVVKREELDGQSGYQGYSEMPIAGRMAGTIRDAGTMTMANFMAKTNSAMQMRLANGKMVSGEQMVCLECTEVKTQEASFTVTFIGQVTETAL